MENIAVRKLNTLSVVIMIWLIPIYVAVLAASYLSVGNTIFSVILIVAYAIAMAVCYLGSLVQGLRSIANGRRSTCKSVANLQIFIYLMNMIWVIWVIIYDRKSIDKALTKIHIFFLAAFLIFIVLALIRKSQLNKANGVYVFDGNGKTALRILGIEVCIPALIAFLVVGGMKLAKKYPVIGKIAGITGAVLFLLFLIAIALSAVSRLSKLFPGGETPSDNTSSTRQTSPAAPKRPSVNNSEVDEFDKEYERKYREVTGGESPWNYQILKEGPKLEAAKKLRTTMRQTAQTKGYVGKSKYFK